MKLLIVILLITKAVSHELNSTLHTTPSGVRFAFADEMVVFTCSVEGSNSITWTSDEYIGAGQPLTIVSVQGVGFELHAVRNPETVAVLVKVTAEIIVSELRIRVRSNYPIASIQCANSSGTATNPTTSILFLLAGAALITCERQSVCPGSTITCSCTTGNSSALAWIANGTRLEFGSSDPPLTRRNATGSSTFAVIIETSEINRIGVITSNITLFVSMSSNDILLTCANVDRTESETIIIPITEACPADQVTTSTGTPGPARDGLENDCAGPIAAAVVVPIIAIVIAAIVIIIVVARGHKLFQAQLNNKDKEIKDLKDTKEQKEAEISAHKETIKEKDTGIDDLKKKNEEKERELVQAKSELKKKETELSTLKEKKKIMEEKALEELKKTVKEDERKALNTLKVKVKEQLLGKALAKKTEAEIDEALKDLDSFMEKEIQSILETSESDKTEWRILAKFYDVANWVSSKFTLDKVTAD